MKIKIFKNYFYGGTELLEEVEFDTIEELKFYCLEKYDIVYWKGKIGFLSNDYPRIVVEY